MGRQRHKRKMNHVVIVTSDAVNASTKHYRMRPWVPRVLLLICCVAVGVLIGLFYFEGSLSAKWMTTNAEQLAEIENLQQEKAALEQEKTELEEEMVALNETIRVLSDTVNQKIQNENKLTEQLEKQLTPTEFPLTGSATMEEVTEGEPMCIFTASSGAMVIATAKGTVSAVNDDATYGHNVWIDHGNGYVTIYRNAGEVKVKQGEAVTQGTTLILINGQDSKLGYQMMKDGAYIDPMDMLAISG